MKPYVTQGVYKDFYFFLSIKNSAFLDSVG